MVKKYQSWLVDPAYNPKGYGRPIECALTEFSIHWDTQNELQISDAIGACWTADVLGYLLDSGIDYSHYFCLGEYGGHAVFNKSGKARTLFWVFDFYKNHARAKRLVSAQGTAADGLVTVHGWIDDGGRWTLVVTNRSDRESGPVRFELRDLRGALVRDARRLTDVKPVALGDTDAELSEDSSGTVLAASLPAHSVTVWELGAD
jgi:hypothetical protein